jgi:peptidoglycan hydrolase CwlO-like protein
MPTITQASLDWIKEELDRLDAENTDLAEELVEANEKIEALENYIRHKHANVDI